MATGTRFTVRRFYRRYRAARRGRVVTGLNMSRQRSRMEAVRTARKFRFY